MGRGEQIRAKYCEKLVAEIFSAIDEILSDDISDIQFLSVQKRVHKIIDREYVPLEDQKK